MKLSEMKIETTSLADMPTELLHELAGAQRTTGPAHTRGEGGLNLYSLTRDDHRPSRKNARQD